MYIRTQKGFTLIELIVSLGIFSIVITLVAGTYFSLISASGNVRTSTSAINNVSFALSAMSYDIRSGTCESGQCGSGDSFLFTNSLSLPVTYSLCTVSSIKPQICKSINGGTPYALTHAPVYIKKLSFSSKTYTAGASSKASQTLTIIRVGGTYTLPHNTQQRGFHLETVVTPRKIYVQ